MQKISIQSAKILILAVLGILILGYPNMSFAQNVPGACPIGGYTINACPIITDAVIRDQIISRLSGSVASASYPVVVSVCNGEVTLQGQVRTAGKKDLATIFASTVRGVKCVRNRLTIDAGVVDDLILVGEVRRSIDRTYVDGKRIGVDVVDGVVELTGATTTEYQREAAQAAAASVTGVTAVHNNITVMGPSGTPF